ncbi:unnamed protein product [Peronospora effusa]|uniref:Uncharacterized protein n=1 Tax=Peronospora effusa TaxID=542832 RepID=A0A3R7XSH1_9STRA|nr:hypothetical protein DD237_001012 [Peronospora effusa]CAI5703681.1 unnamed protein product [Peronospora effusa]
MKDAKMKEEEKNGELEERTEIEENKMEVKERKIKIKEKEIVQIVVEKEESVEKDEVGKNGVKKNEAKTDEVETAVASLKDVTNEYVAGSIVKDCVGNEEQRYGSSHVYTEKGEK